MNSPKEDISANKRSHRITTGLVLLAILVVLAILAKGLTLNPNSTGNALQGRKASDFSADWLQGKKFLPNNNSPQFQLKDFAGKALILNFWASWCVSCRNEAREMEAFWKKHQDEPVVLVGIAIQDSTENAMNFAKYYGKTYILGLDTTDGKISLDYGVTGVPETFFIDSNGVVIDKITGPVDVASMEKILPKLLPKK